MNLPENVVLEPADAERLRKLNLARTAVASFIQNVVQAGEARSAALIEQGQVLWTELATKYKLDLDTLHYELDPTGKPELKIVGARFQ